MADKKKYTYPEYMKKWRAENAEHMRQKQREWYLAHGDDVRHKAVERNKRNWDRHLLGRKVTYSNNKYPGKITIADVDVIIERYGRKCHWCGKGPLVGKDLTIEHLKPINAPRYIVIACYACNCARIPERGPRKTDEEKRIARNTYLAGWRKQNAEHLAEYYRARYRKAKKAKENK